MIRSMTGFGEASAQEGGVHYVVELRSVNNRYFKATIRLPEAIAGLDAELETHLRKMVQRGSVTMTVKMKVAGAHAASRVNDAALLVYLDHLETIHSKIADQSVQIDLTQLLALPGVLQSAEEELSLLDKARPVLLRLTEEAAGRLTAMRATEGRAIAEDLLRQSEAINVRLQTVKERAPSVVEEYHQRLRSRIDQLMARAELKVGESELIREVAVFAERADISEEVSRLTGHLEQFHQVIHAPDGETAGRTLDFIAQEMLREANTIASKSNDARISRAIVEVKSAIDRIKEQVQNVE
jgi:uncharacterized protein (TIGR00255 family)